MLTANRLREVRSYDPDTGVFRWRVRVNSRTVVGKRAGFSRRDGYRLIGVDGRIYLEHRLAWLHVTGNWPVNDIDHRDVDPSNNRFANLREATHALNHRNKRTPSTNTSGFKGVTWCKKDAVWQAQIKLRGRCHYLGRFDDPKAAHAAYVAASKRLHGEFGRAS